MTGGGADRRDKWCRVRPDGCGPPLRRTGDRPPRLSVDLQAMLVDARSANRSRQSEMDVPRQVTASRRMAFVAVAIDPLPLVSDPTAFRDNPRGVQNFAGVDVADAGNEALISRKDLTGRRRPAARPSMSRRGWIATDRDQGRHRALGAPEGRKPAQSMPMSRPASNANRSAYGEYPGPVSQRRRPDIRRCSASVPRRRDGTPATCPGSRPGWSSPPDCVSPQLFVQDLQPPDGLPVSNRPAGVAGSRLPGNSGIAILFCLHSNVQPSGGQADFQRRRFPAADRIPERRDAPGIGMNSS